MSAPFISTWAHVFVCRCVDRKWFSARLLMTIFSFIFFHVYHEQPQHCRSPLAWPAACVTDHTGSLRLGDAYMRQWTGSLWFRQLHIACSASSHNLNQCWSTVNYISGNRTTEIPQVHSHEVIIQAMTNITHWLVHKQPYISPGGALGLNSETVESFYT